MQYEHSRSRRHDPRRMPAGHDGVRARVDRERRAQTHEVHRGLQEPARSADTARLQELEEATVPAQVPSLVGAHDPTVAVRHVGLDEVLETREVQCGHRDALVRRVGRHVVLLPEARHEAEDPIETRAALCRCAGPR